MSPSRLEIRRATARDSASIAAVLRSAFAEYRRAYTPAAFAETTPSPQRIAARLREGPAWVAVRGKAVLATVSARAEGRTFFLRGMAVVPSAQGRGVAKLLLERAERAARVRGCRTLRLYSTPFLTRAIGIYESFGFRRPSGRRADLLGTPLFAMTKPLPAGPLARGQRPTKKDSVRRKR